jgi:serine/threonine protein kinase
MEQIGRYKVVGELGRGAMGIVFKAEDPAIGRMIAIKSIRLGELTDEGERARLRDRLFREAQSAGILSHPGIVTIYDIAEEGGMAYIFMELVNGPPLERLLKSDRPPDKETLLSLLRQTAAALDYAHKKGIVHRDVKPANIMVHEDGTAKITDFGVAKIVSQQMTRAGTIMGTPSYMSPEQVQGDAVSGRSDQFSLAVIAYEILTGEKPFQAEYLPTLLFKIVGEDPVAPHRLNLTLPEDVEPVLRQALAKKPEDRYETCSEFVAALAASCADSLWVPLPNGASESMPTMGARSSVVEMSGDTVAVQPEDSLRTTEQVRAASRDDPDATLADVPSGAVADGKAVTGSPADEAPSGTIESSGVVSASNPAWTPRPRAETPSGLGAGTIVLGILAALVVIGVIVFISRDSRTASVSEPASVAGSAQPSTSSSPAATPTTGTEKDGNTQAAVTAPANGTAGGTVPDATPSEIGPARADFHLTTDPSGAAAIFDGNADQHCTSPCALSLPVGRHSVVVRRDGYREAERVFNLPDEPGLIITMTPRTGILSLVSTPPGLAIFVDGQEQPRKTPASLSLPIGSHRIQIVKGTDKQDFAVEIRDGVFTERSVDWSN